MTQSCKTCAHLDVALDKAGRRVVRKDNAYRCNAPEPDVSSFPASITGAHGFRARFTRSHMMGTAGFNCPAWKGLDK